MSKALPWLLLAGGAGFLLWAAFRRRQAIAAGGPSPNSTLGNLLCSGAAVFSGNAAALPFCPQVGEAVQPLVGASVDQATGIINAYGGAMSGVIGAGGRLASGLIDLQLAPFRAASTVASDVYGGTKTVIGDTYSGVKSGVASVGSGAVSVVKKLNPFSW